MDLLIAVGKLRLHHILKDESGLSVVVGTIIVLAILIAAFIAFYPVYCEAGVRWAEANHVKSIGKKFLDIQGKVQRMEEGSSESVSFTMVPNYPPFVRYPRSAGTLSGNPGSENHFGIINFRKRNLFHPNQTYIYEGDAVILDQKGVFYMQAKPLMINVWDIYGADIGVRVNYIQIENERKSISSIGARTLKITCENFIAKPQVLVDNVIVSLKDNIFTLHENVWIDYLQDVRDDLDDRGYNVILDNVNLILTIDNKSGGNIYYIESIKEILVDI